MNVDEASRLVFTASEGTTFFKIWMPYAYVRLEEPSRKHTFLPLNRNYKPLGYARPEFVQYADYLDTHAVVFSRDPAGFNDIWSNISNAGMLWLYDDNPKSRLDYFARLERLTLKGAVLFGSLSSRAP